MPNKLANCYNQSLESYFKAILYLQNCITVKQVKWGEVNIDKGKNLSLKF